MRAASTLTLRPRSAHPPANHGRRGRDFRNARASVFSAPFLHPCPPPLPSYTLSPPVPSDMARGERRTEFTGSGEFLTLRAVCRRWGDLAVLGAVVAQRSTSTVPAVDPFNIDT